jgi:hypothetical protein
MRIGTLVQVALFGAVFHGNVAGIIMLLHNFYVSNKASQL